MALVNWALRMGGVDVWKGSDDMARFKLFRYRRPSLRTALGVTRAKRRFKTRTDYYAATRWMRAPYNMRRRALRRVGYYSGPMKFLRFLLDKHGR